MSEKSHREALYVQQNVDKATELYEKFSKDILGDESFCRLLKDYEQEIEKSWSLMRDLGLPSLCSWCATQVKGGGCCGSHIATWYDPITLLLNLLMGVPLREKSYYEDSCRFLGKDGCTLKARYHFCVNYLCSRIYERFTPESIAKLKAQAGAELYLAWQLELLLRDFFKNRGVPSSMVD